MCFKCMRWQLVGTSGKNSSPFGQLNHMPFVAFKYWRKLFLGKAIKQHSANRRWAEDRIICWIL
jgi:hypothetical protein